MESKRTLWIIVAAGSFLLAVFGLCAILSSPQVQQQKTASQRASLDAHSGWITSQDAEPVSKDPLSSNSFMTSEDSFASNTNGEKSADQFDQISNPFSDSSIQTQVVQQTDQKMNPNGFSPMRTENVTVISDSATIISQDTTKIDLNTLKNAAASNVTAQNELTENQLNNARNAQLAQAEVKTVEPVPVKTESKKSDLASAKTNSIDNSKVSKVKDKFWVQVAAYSNIDNAKAARTALESNKIQCDIFTVSTNGKDLYRVQSGPYMTRNEAEHWGELIGKIDKFSSTKSMIVKNN